MHERPDLPDSPEQAAEALAAIVRSSPSAIFTIRLGGTIETWNRGAEKLYGLSAAEAIGLSFRDIFPEDRDGQTGWTTEVLRRGESIEDLEVQRTLPNGRRADLAVTMSPVIEPDGTVERVAAIVSDITELKDTERRLAESLDELRATVFRDRLTGVGSRELLMDRLTSLPAGARDITVVLADVDEFQYFNQTFGHGTADRVLCSLTAVLLELVEDDDLVVRTGGDEFAIVVMGKEAGYGTRLARQIQRRLATPIAVGDAHHSVSMGIGVASVSQPVPGLADFLLRRADIAQHEAKTAGHGLWREYDARMEAAVVGRVQIEERLRRAMATGGELRMVYQPLCEAATGRIVEVEALLRWDDPEHGPISPADFIPVAETSGCIVELGEWVLQTACTEIGRLTGPGDPLRLNVNVSPRQLADPGFAAVVARALAASGLPADRLVLEITESAIVGSGETMVAELHRLRALGIGLAVDDFGTGHSSLARLHALPFTTLKIDKSLVDGVEGAGGGDVIVDAVVRMSHGLGLAVVAEGVERSGQLARLRDLGCDLIQGFLLHRPLAPDGLRAALHTQAASVA